MEPIIVLIKEKPENSNYVEGGYTKLPHEKAFELISDGYAVGYNPKTKEEFYPFLDEEFPKRDILFDAGIYTSDHLKKCLGYVKTLKGIGKKTIDSYKELLGE